MNKGIKRRDFFKLAAVGGATAAAAGCEPDKVENIIPMLVPPTEYVPGVALNFATTCNECSAQCGLVIRTREGRAIKADGNPKNPLNAGKVCALGQGSMQGLYAPSRQKGPATQKGGEQSALTWAEGKKLLAEQLAAAAGSVVYIGRPASGSIKGLQAALGKALYFDPQPTSAIKAGNRLAFGKSEIPHYAIEDAKLLVSFGADFMEAWGNPVANLRGYSKMHAFQGGAKGKYIHVSAHMSLTGTNADEWIDCNPGTEAQVALAVAHELLGNAALGGGDKDRLQAYLADYSPAAVEAASGVKADAIKALADAIHQSSPSLVLGGGTTASGSDATALQVAVNLLNYIAGNIGKTVQFGADYQMGGDSVADILTAVKGAKLVIVENANLVYGLPVGSGIKDALSKVPFVVALSTEIDETTAMAHLHLPTSHYLESWGDAAPRAGVKSLQQPVMAKIPGYDTVELGDLLLELTGKGGAYRTYLQAQWGVNDAEWKQLLQQGGRFSDFSATGASLAGSATSVKPKARKAEGLTILPANSPLHNASGTTGNRTWFLEVQHPVTQLVWDSWVEIHPETGIKLGLKHGDEVVVKTAAGEQTLGVWFWYGINRNAISMPTGRGRTVAFPTYVSTRNKSILLPHVEMASDVTIKGIKVGESVNELLAFALDESGDLAFNETSATLTKTGQEAWLVTTEGMARDDMERDPEGRLSSEIPGGMGDRSQKGRGFVQAVELAVALGAKEAHAHGHHLRERHYKTDLPSNTDFYQERAKDVEESNEWRGRDKPVYYEKYKWEMAIDLDRCIGCAACTVACYAENNINIVGKERIWTGREMAWLRVERYIEHNPETGKLETYYTPEMCSQCGNAGCEPVCPVYATYHNDEGINAMIYNRCVGTRYCLNNCIYKQRRFNWRDYEFPAPLHLQLNPAVSVRTKGVMEKCNFCIARIREGKDIAKDQGREVFDGEVMTACQQTCPTDAIIFGNIKDQESQVTKVKSTTKRGYLQLEEMNFKPAITYLKKVTHDNKKA